jgi:putative aminopeptidase FrvX
MKTLNTKLLSELIEIQGVSSDESAIKSFLLNYIQENSRHWKSVPLVIDGPEFHDSFILVFGKPKTAIFAHIDTIGFSTGYNKELVKVGSPKIIDETILVGKDSHGSIETELMVIEDYHGTSINYLSDREFDRGTLLSFKPNFRETETYIQSPYLDNRLGVYVALKVAETLENGAIVFSTYEEHGGNTAEYCAHYLMQEYQTRQALICDITWVTSGVVHNAGAAISLRDSLLPRRAYLNRILDIVKQTEIPFQLEVESAGGSDGSIIQKSGLMMDWCFIGAPEDNVHSPNEKVYKSDIASMIALYDVLMEKL